MQNRFLATGVARLETTDPLDAESLAALKAMLNDDELTAEKMVRRATQTLRTMKVSMVRPAGFKSNMPEIVRTYWEAYNVGSDAPTRTQPKKQDIDLVDKMLGWVAQVDGTRRRKLIWLRANRVSWRKCAQRLGWSHEWSRRQYQEAMRQLAIVIQADPEAERAWRQADWFD